MDNLFDKPEKCSVLDANQVEKENFNHARESLSGLRHLAKKTYSPQPSAEAEAHAKRLLKDPYRRAPNKAQYWPKPSRYVHDSLADAKAWLDMHRSELPPEIENENGQLYGNQYLGLSGADETAEDVDDTVADSSREDSTFGLFYMSGSICYEPLEATAAAVAKKSPEFAADVGAHGIHEENIHMALLMIRGEKLKKHREHQAKMLRWRGMQEYRAIGTADELLEQGVTLRKAKSGARECPSQERLNELLSYDPVTGALTWAVSRGRCKAGDVAYRLKDGRPRTRVDGVDYYAARLVYKMVTGEDAGESTIDFVNSDVADLSWDNLAIQHASTSSEGYATERVRSASDSKYHAQCITSKGRITIGSFDTEREAIEARRIFVKAMTYGD